MLCQRCHIGTRHPSTIYDNLAVRNKQPAHYRPRLRELPFPGPWFEPSVGPGTHPIERLHARVVSRPPPVRNPARAAGRRAIAGASPAPPPRCASGTTCEHRAKSTSALRVSGVSGDPARYQRLRDLRDGPTLDRLRYDRDTAGWKFQAAMDHVGYRDQRYQATFARYGKVKGSVEWNQIPLFYSADTRTPFRSESPGVFRLDDSLQAAIQNGTATTRLLVPESRLFPLRSRRDIADIRLVYAAKPTLDLRVGVQQRQTHRRAALGRVLRASQRRRACRAGRSSNQRVQRGGGMVEPPRDGQARPTTAPGLTIDVETFIWDNPLRADRPADAPAQGRMALWPDSTAHTVSARGLDFASRTQSGVRFGVDGRLVAGPGAAAPYDQYGDRADPAGPAHRRSRGADHRR